MKSMGKAGARFLCVVFILLIAGTAVSAADTALFGPKAPEPQIRISAKIGGLVGEMLDEFNAGGGLNRIVWSAEKQEQFCENQAMRLADMPPEKRAESAGIVIKNCEISIRAYESGNRDGKNNHKISGGYVRLAALYGYAGPEYAANRLDALNTAIKMDPYDGLAWEEKAEFLDESGFPREAQAVRDEKERLWEEQRETAGGLFSLFGMGMTPLSPFAVICGLLIVVILSVRRRYQNPQK
jgi:hypothetical protein